MMLLRPLHSRWRRPGALGTGLILAVAGLTFGAATSANANSYNWGSPTDVCNQVWSDSYEDGMCVEAISPQQVVNGTTSLQYMVSCSDAPTSGNTSNIDGPMNGAGEGPYFQSLGAVMSGGAASYNQVVAWSTGSSVVSGEITTATAVVGQADGSSVQAWGATPVKVYNAEVAWDSTNVTFGAACLNALGVTCWADPSNTDCEQAYISTADAADRRISAARIATSQTRSEFASGKRKRAEFQVRAITASGVEVHDRINLRQGKKEKTSLLCPRGMSPAGDPQVSYGFDALKDVSGYEPNIRATRTWSKRGVTVAYSAGKLKYPTVAYTILPCGKA